MPFDAGNRVHDQTTAGVVNGGITLGFDTGLLMPVYPHCPAVVRLALTVVCGVYVG